MSDLFKYSLSEFPYTKGKPSMGSSGLHKGVSVQWHLALTAATVGSLEKSTGTLSNTLKILVEHYFNNYQLAHLPPASPCVCSLPPELGWGVELLGLLEKKLGEESLLSSSRKRRFTAKGAAEHSRVWCAKGAKQFLFWCIYVTDTKPRKRLWKFISMVWTVSF